MGKYSRLQNVSVCLADFSHSEIQVNISAILIEFKNLILN